MSIDQTIAHFIRFLDDLPMPPRTKLELTWVGKEKRSRLEPRILLEDPELSYHAKQRVSETDIFDNHLIFGDNLLALKALEQEFTGKVKCICIDPPYNTGSAFMHYEDGLEHSLWLSLMRERIGILRNLLSKDGSLWIFIDDNKVHYLKVLCDEVFGRKNFIANVIWQKKYAPANDANSVQYSFDGDSKQAYSVFTRYLVRGLKTGDADTNKDGNISIDELYDYIYENVTIEKPQ